MVDIEYIAGRGGAPQRELNKQKLRKGESRCQQQGHGRGSEGQALERLGGAGAARVALPGAAPASGLLGKARRVARRSCQQRKCGARAAAGGRLREPDSQISAGWGCGEGSRGGIVKRGSASAGGSTRRGAAQRVHAREAINKG